MKGKEKKERKIRKEAVRGSFRLRLSTSSLLEQGHKTLASSLNSPKDVFVNCPAIF